MGGSFSRKAVAGQDNRAARRAADSNRKRAERAILQFHRTAQASHGAIETHIIGDFPTLLSSAAEGDTTAQALVDVILIWLREAARREQEAPDTKFLCLDCEAEFGPNTGKPVAFSVAMPFSDQRRAIVTGICAHCATKGEDLMQMALRRLRSIWPGAYSLGKPGVA